MVIQNQMRGLARSFPMLFISRPLFDFLPLSTKKKATPTKTAIPAMDKPKKLVNVKKAITSIATKTTGLIFCLDVSTKVLLSQYLSFMSR